MIKSLDDLREDAREWAADEIARLRAENAQLQALVSVSESGCVSRLEAEVERLRTLLAKTLKAYLDTEYYEQSVVEEARAALDPQK